MLKTIRLFEELALRTFRAGNDEIVGGGDGRADEIVIDSSKSKKREI